jgi:hypothetical protein
MEMYPVLQTEKLKNRRPAVRDSFCRPERKAEPETETASEHIFSVVVETTNYRVEIEIG